MKQQYIVTLTIHKIDFHIIRQLISNTSSVKILCPQKFASPYIFVKV